jgi:hypothetical protein
MPTCKRCGFESAEVTLACQSCGQPFSAPDLRASRWSLMLGLASYPLLIVFGIGACAGLLAVAYGIVALVRARRAPAALGGRRSAVAGILLGGSCVALATVLVLPALIASRTQANEVATIGDIRTILQAEVQYSNVNGDSYDTLECLAAPARCIPGYDKAKPAFLPADLAAAHTKNGYLRTFHAGPASKGPRSKEMSPSSIATYAYVAVPASPGSTGVRSFCGDGSGRVCAMRDGSMPAVADGVCADSCPDLK